MSFDILPVLMLTCLDIKPIRRGKEIFPSADSPLYLDFACIREFMMVLRRNAEICRPPHRVEKGVLQPESNEIINHLFGKIHF